jgi:hypothetical protein
MRVLNSHRAISKAWDADLSHASRRPSDLLRGAHPKKRFGFPNFFQIAPKFYLDGICNINSLRLEKF